MGQAALDLPDPANESTGSRTVGEGDGTPSSARDISSASLNEEFTEPNPEKDADSSADDLLAQLAGAEVDRLLREAEDSGIMDAEENDALPSRRPSGNPRKHVNGLPATNPEESHAATEATATAGEIPSSENINPTQQNDQFGHASAGDFSGKSDPDANNPSSPNTPFKETTPKATADAITGEKFVPTVVPVAEGLTGPAVEETAQAEATTLAAVLNDAVIIPSERRTAEPGAVIGIPPASDSTQQESATASDIVNASADAANARVAGELALEGTTKAEKNLLDVLAETEAAEKESEVLNGTSAAARSLLLQADGDEASSLDEPGTEKDHAMGKLLSPVIKILEWINLPLAEDRTREIVGKIALVTFINAIAILIYVFVFRRRH